MFLNLPSMLREVCGRILANPHTFLKDMKNTALQELNLNRFTF